MIKKGEKEQILLKKILIGNKSAIKEFYDAYVGYLTTVCTRYIADKEDIKDVLQESFIKIFRSIDKFEYKGDGSLRAWATRIVINESLKFIKTKGKLSIIDAPMWELPDMIEEEEPDFNEIPTETILEMIKSLPVGYRTIFNLYVFEQKSHKEIASILNISENTSASQLHRAKALLSRQINEYKPIKKLG